MVARLDVEEERFVAVLERLARVDDSGVVVIQLQDDGQPASCSGVVDGRTRCHDRHVAGPSHVAATSAVDTVPC